MSHNPPRPSGTPPPEGNECGHEEEVIIVISAAAGVETIADKCTACGRITNKRTET